MKVKKMLNQNAVLVLDEGQEEVAVSKDVGLNRTKDDVLSRQLVERMFVIESGGLERLQVLLSQTEDRYFLTSEEIIQHAETVLGEKLNERINIGLSDHIAFAAENVQNNIIVRNKLLNEAEILYSGEFAIARWAVEYLTQTLEIPFSYGETGYIATHIHGARSGHTNDSKSIREVTIVSEIIHLIEQELAIDIRDDRNSLSYSHLVDHLRLFTHRFQQSRYAVLDEEISGAIKRKYAGSYEIPKKVQVLLMKNSHCQVSNEELDYLSVHIERLRMAK